MMCVRSCLFRLSVVMVVLVVVYIMYRSLVNVALWRRLCSLLPPTLACLPPPRVSHSPLSLSLLSVKVEKRDEDSSRMQLKEEVSGENKVEGLIRRSVLGQLSFMS